MGPLTSLLNRTVEASRGKKLNLNKLTELTDKVALCVNQATNQVLYQRRKNLLTAAVRSETSAKNVLTQYSSEISQSKKTGLLFGKNYTKLWKR